MGPKHRHLIVRDEGPIDWEAIGYTSALNPVQHHVLNFLEVYEVMKGKGQLHRGWCKTCTEFGTAQEQGKPTSDLLRRPPGARDRGGCNGCLISYLNEFQELGPTDEELLADWVDALEHLKDVEASRRYVKTAKEQKHWRARKAAAKRDLDDAVRACELAGVPMKRARRGFVERLGLPAPELTEGANSSADIRRT